MNNKKAISKNPIEDARENNLELLYNIIDCDANRNNDYKAYKWLWVAKNFGSMRVDALIEDIEEISSLKYDDDGYKKANVHYELAIAYLSGDEGLPVDLFFAEEHLKMASEYIDLRDFITQVISNFKGEKKKLLETYLEPSLDLKIIQSIKQVNLLREVKAPKIILENEEEQLKKMFKIFIKKV